MQTAQRTKPVKEAASEFLSNKRIAVTGVSRNPAGHGSNVVYQRLRGRGYEVFPVNPNADQVEGDRCYPDLKSIPGGVSAVVIGTRPELAESTMRECVELGIKHVAGEILCGLALSTGARLRQTVTERFRSELGVKMRAGAVALVLMLAACGSSSAPLAQTSPSPSANPASASPSATPVPTGDLISVAAQIYPFQAGRYVTCDSGYGGSKRYSHCPVTARLGDRLLTVFSGYISAPEPLGGGQDPEWATESITADPSGTGGVAHVVLTKPASPSSRYDLVLVSSGGNLLVDDIYCTGADPATSSIYVAGWMDRFAC